jgi:hypothetical protein
MLIYNNLNSEDIIMHNQHCFYALKDGKSYRSFNKNPLHFKMFEQETPIKVVVNVLNDEAEKFTHVGLLNKEGRLEHIHTEAKHVKTFLGLKEDEEVPVHSGRIVKLQAAAFES